MTEPEFMLNVHRCILSYGEDCYSDLWNAFLPQLYHWMVEHGDGDWTKRYMGSSADDFQRRFKNPSIAQPGFKIYFAEWKKVIW